MGIILIMLYCPKGLMDQLDGPVHAQVIDL